MPIDGWNSLEKRAMIKVALNEAKDQLSKYIKKAVRDEVIVTKHGRPAAVIIGFESEEDWFDYRLENDERFLARVEESRRQLRRGDYVFLEDLPG